MADDQEFRRRIRDLLVPRDEPVGDPARRRGIRIVQGSLNAAQSIFDQLKEMGEVEKVASYNGSLVRLGGEGRVGLRPASKSGGPPIDVALECVPETRKIKFVQGASR